MQSTHEQLTSNLVCMRLSALNQIFRRPPSPYERVGSPAADSHVLARLGIVEADSLSGVDDRPASREGRVTEVR